MTKRIWITRTEPGASRLAAQLLESGYEPVIAPVFEIVALHSSSPPIDTDLWVFVSTHAVAHAADLRWERTKPTIAVGPATAAQLESIQIQPILPTRHSSEGIYDLIRSHYNPPMNVTIVCGRDGRKDLVKWLSNDGYVCGEWIVYERKPTHIQINTSLLDAIVIASGAAIAVVRAQFASTDSVSTPLVVPSYRDVELAKSLKFIHVRISAGASDSSTVEALDALFTR